MACFMLIIFFLLFLLFQPPEPLAKKVTAGGPI